MKDVESKPQKRKGIGNMNGFFALVAILCIIFGPLLSIWSLNTLFPALLIPYTLKTWFAIIVVGGIFAASNNTKK